MGVTWIVVPYVFLVAIIVFFGIVFPFWMFIHGVMRTIKLWPQDAQLNLLLLAAIFFFDFFGAIIYYFAVYRKSGSAPA